MRLKQSLGALAVAAAVSSPAWACSICRCGDPTFNALGQEGVALTGMRLALDWDQVASGATDPDTGGTMFYITPRILFDVGGGWVLRASGQIPLSQGGLYGEQHEDAVLNLGITKLFAR